MIKRRISGDDWVLADRLIYMYQKYDNLYKRDMEHASLRTILAKIERSSDTHILELTENEWDALKMLIERAKADIDTIQFNMMREERNGQTNC